MLSHEAILSLAQYLSVQETDVLVTLLDKHSLDWLQVRTAGNFGRDVLGSLCRSLESASEDALHGLLAEIALTKDDLRYRVSPKYRHDQRWKDLTALLELDGYSIETGELRRIEPVVPGAPPLADDLHEELNRSHLPRTSDIGRLVSQAVNAFGDEHPDYNAALGDARIALQTLALDIADAWAVLHPGRYEPTKWGQILAYLRVSGLIAPKEEEALAGVYSFLSDGTHRPVRLSEHEMARLGISLAMAMLYFLIKTYNAAR